MKSFEQWKAEVAGYYPDAAFKKGEWKGLIRARATDGDVGFYNTDESLANRSYWNRREGSLTFDGWKHKLHTTYPDFELKKLKPDSTSLIAWMANEQVGCWHKSAKDSYWYVSYGDHNIEEGIRHEVLHTGVIT